MLPSQDVVGMDGRIDEGVIQAAHGPTHDLVRCDFGTFVVYRCLFCRFELTVVEGTVDEGDVDAR
jgi:hypothetical protein